MYDRQRHIVLTYTYTLYMTHLQSTCMFIFSTFTSPFIRATTYQCSDPFPGASSFALTSCPNISAFEGLSQSSLPLHGTWLLLKATLLTTDSYFREAETEWEWERRGEKGVSMCLIWCVLVRLLQESEMFHCRICFLPIKQTLISVTMPELRGFGAPGCYLCSVKSKLGYSVYIKKKSWLQHIRAKAARTTQWLSLGLNRCSFPSLNQLLESCQHSSARTAASLLLVCYSCLFSLCLSV